MTLLSGNEESKKHCYIGLGGGIGLYIDSQFPREEITDERIISLKEKLKNFAKLCEESENSFVDDCLAGLMGTRFRELYRVLQIKYDRIEALKLRLDVDFEIVG